MYQYTYSFNVLNKMYISLYSTHAFIKFVYFRKLVLAISFLYYEVFFM
jgi:hypothetical protein